MGDRLHLAKIARAGVDNFELCVAERISCAHRHHRTARGRAVLREGLHAEVPVARALQRAKDG